MAISKFPIVENCCLCATASAEYTVVLISPNSNQLSVNIHFHSSYFSIQKISSLQSYTEKYFGISEWQRLVDNNDFNEQILKDVQDACRKGGIERFETPQRVKIVLEAWTPETGLVTDALKLKRKAIDQKYNSIIDALYADKSNPE